jgi:hypothetical protein
VVQRTSRPGSSASPAEVGDAATNGHNPFDRGSSSLADLAADEEKRREFDQRRAQATSPERTRARAAVREAAAVTDAKAAVRDAAAAANPVFDASAALAHIAAVADARGVSRVGVLAQVLLRVGLATPPAVVLPPLIGATSGLALFHALTGEVGGGKGTVEAIAADAVRLRVRGAVVRTQPVTPATGEGLVSAFGDSRVVDGVTTVSVHTPAVLFSFADVETFDKLANRAGATLSGMLLSMFMGSTLGAMARDGARRVMLPAHSVIGALNVGVQPSNGTVLLRADMAGNGLPQRFCWTPTRSGWETTRCTPPPPLTVDLPDWGTTDAADPYSVAVPEVREYRPGEGIDPAELIALDLADEVAAEITAADAAKSCDVFGAVPPGEDQLSGHLMLTREKVTALLGILHGATAVTADWWAAAALIMDVSTATIDAARVFSDAAARQDAERDGELLGRRGMAADRVKNHNVLVSRVADALCARVGADWSTVDTSKVITASKQYLVGDAWELLCGEDGPVERREHTWSGRRKTWQYRRRP